MQDKVKQAWGMVALLVGAALVLSGCVAPDGTVFRLQQAPDGTITGLQAEPSPDAAAPVEEPVADAESFPARPILFLGGDANVGIAAVESDGTLIGPQQDGMLFGWSPQGDRFAYLPLGEEAFEGLAVAALGEEERLIFTPDLDSQIINYVRQSVWSPDGTQIALVLFSTQGFELVLIDAESGEIAKSYRLPDDVAAMYLGFVQNEVIFPMVNWSPDGRKVLLSLGELVVLDLESGDAEIVVSGISLPGMGEQAEWLPSSDGFIYLDGYEFDGERFTPPQLWQRMLDEDAPQELLSTEQMVTLGLDGSDQFAITISPSRRYLALLGINNGVDEGTEYSSTLLALDLTTLKEGSIEQWATEPPAAAWTLPGLTFFIEWSPDEQQFAFLMLSEEQGATIEVLSWADEGSQTVANVFVGDGSGVFTGINYLSWMP
jgi:hypothetical protein